VLAVATRQHHGVDLRIGEHLVIVVEQPDAPLAAELLGLGAGARRAGDEPDVVRLVLNRADQGLAPPADTNDCRTQHHCNSPFAPEISARRTQLERCAHVNITIGFRPAFCALTRAMGRTIMDYREVSEIRDGMRIDWDVPIEMDDGLVMRADVFRPVKEGKYPVLLSYGPYGKWLHFEDGYKTAWTRMAETHPDVIAGSTNKYQSWEVCDPEKWVPDGYACVRVDSRGCGRSPGHVEHWSPREAEDFAQCIEWAGKQKWSNGKV